MTISARQTEIYAHRIKDAARLLNVSIPTVYRLVKVGSLQIVKICGVSLIRDADIRRLLGMTEKTAA